MRANLSFAGVILVAGAILAGSGAGTARGETFPFGGSQNNFNGLDAATLSSGTFEMQLAAGIPGSKLNETSSSGMGIDGRPLSGTGAIDTEPALFNTLSGTGPFSGAAESIRFSFDRQGMITGMNFDGVKDESLEYFILERSDGARWNFFDSAANNFVHPVTMMPVIGSVDDAAMAGAVSGIVIYLAENAMIDDEAQGLAIPFAAGQEFTLAFHFLGPEFGSALDSNGARFQGITVVAVPEPASPFLAATGMLLATWLAAGRRKSRDFVLPFPCS
jgi:hypothetical protein